MDRASALELLRRAQEHADSEAEHIKTQEETVQRLASKGYDTSAAAKLLAVMRATLVSYEHHCEALQRILSTM